MEVIAGKPDPGFRDARRKLTALVGIDRWVWVINAAVMLIGVYYGRFDIAALAGFTWILTLIATAIGARVAANLGEPPDEPAEPTEPTDYT
jgi:hypothetical protein